MAIKKSSSSDETKTFPRISHYTTEQIGDLVIQSAFLLTLQKLSQSDDLYSAV